MDKIDSSDQHLTGYARDDFEQAIMRVMGEYGFSMPSRAYAELIDEFMCITAALVVKLARVRALCESVESAYYDTGEFKSAVEDAREVRAMLDAIQKC